MIIKKIFGPWVRKKNEYLFILSSKALKAGLLSESDQQVVKDSLDKVVFRKPSCFLVSFGICFQGRVLENVLGNFLIDGFGGILLYRVTSYYLLEGVFEKLEGVVERNGLDKRVGEMGLTAVEKGMIEEIREEISFLNEKKD